MREWIYLLQLREHVNINANIYKIGRTTQNQFKRFRQYPKGSIILLHRICNDCKIMEKEIIQKFKQLFKHEYQHCGNEYFSGSSKEMIKLINSILDYEDIDDVISDEMNDVQESDLCGYTKYKLPIEKISVGKEIKKHGLFDFADIDVDYGECEEIYKLICSGDATTRDKMKFLKYDFEVNLLGLDHGLDDDTLKMMFNNYQQNPTMIHRVHEGFMLEKKDHTTVSCYTDNIVEKKKVITELNAVLGVENCYTECELNRDVLKGVVEYMNENKEDMKRLFMFNTHKDFDSVNEKALMGTLNTIYSEYIGMGFRFGKQQRKMVNGERIDITPITMSPFQITEKKTVVFDMKGFVDCFKMRIETNTEPEEWYPKECVLREIPEDDITPTHYLNQHLEDIPDGKYVSTTYEDWLENSDVANVLITNKNTGTD
jgi:hypothetical protein